MVGGENPAGLVPCFRRRERGEGGKEVRGTAVATDRVTMADIAVLRFSSSSRFGGRSTKLE